MTTAPWSPRQKLGRALIVAGLGIWLIGALLHLGNVTGLFPTIPYAGMVVTGLGSFAEGIGWALVRGDPILGLEKRRTSLVIVIPALVLFGVVLLGAAMVFGANFDQATSSQRWIATAIFLAVSLFIFSALVREVALRFGASSAKPGAA